MGGVSYKIRSRLKVRVATIGGVKVDVTLDDPSLKKKRQKARRARAATRAALRQEVQDA